MYSLFQGLDMDLIMERSSCLCTSERNKMAEKLNVKPASTMRNSSWIKRCCSPGSISSACSVALGSTKLLKPGKRARQGRT
jgi:hypothetical protein